MFEFTNWISGNKFIVLLIGTLIFFSGCGNVKDSKDYNVLVGGYRSLDHTVAFPYILETAESKLLLKDHFGEQIDVALNFKGFEEGDTIQMNKTIFEIIYSDTSRTNIFLLNDTLRFPIFNGNKYWPGMAKFFPALNTAPMLASEMYNILTGKTFKTIEKAENPNDHLKVEKYLSFTVDSLKTKRDYLYQNEIIYSEFQVQKFKIFNVGTKAFLSCNEDENNPQPIYQFVKNSNNRFSLRHFPDNNALIEKFELSNEPHHDYSIAYRNCFDGYVGEYYHTDVTYPKGNDFLIKKVGQDAPLDKGNGYIVIHYNVNCEGKMGRPGLQMMDSEYRDTTYSLDLVKHIMSQVMKLKEWPSTKSEGQHYINYRDIHGFLMFKIENGKITDLCP